MQIWKEKPRNVLIIDLEYVAGSVNSLGEFATFEIAIADVEGKWIVEQTTIDHGLTVGQLAKKIQLAHEKRVAGRQAAVHTRMRGHSLKKFYGSDWTRCTPGLTWDLGADCPKARRLGPYPWEVQGGVRWVTGTASTVCVAISRTGRLEGQGSWCSSHAPVAGDTTRLNENVGWGTASGCCIGWEN